MLLVSCVFKYYFYFLRNSQLKTSNLIAVNVVDKLVPKIYLVYGHLTKIDSNVFQDYLIKTYCAIQSEFRR